MRTPTSPTPSVAPHRLTRRTALAAAGALALRPSLADAKNRPARAYITAAIKWRGTKVQLFSTDGTYERFDLDSGQVEAGYPKPIDNSTWPGLGDYATDIIAACDIPGGKSYFFLSDASYIRYDEAADRADPGYPKPVNNRTWPGLADHAADLISALTWKDGKLQFFLADGTYIRYDIAADRADPGYPMPVDNQTWPGLAPYRTQLAGTINLDNRKAYFFLRDGRIIRYDIAADHVDPGFPRG